MTKKLTQYQIRQMRLTDEQKEKEKKKRRERDKNVYNSNEESKRKKIYSNLKSYSKRFLLIATDEHLLELEQLLSKEKEKRNLK